MRLPPLERVTSEKIFVFGSNLAGRHGKGAALAALREHGAVYGQGAGRQGSSYAIPTKDEELRPLALNLIAMHVDGFLRYARACPELTFEVTRVGCGLAGYSDGDVSPFFADAPKNCELPIGWRKEATRVVHCKKEPYDVYVGRPSIWGNSFSHKDGTLAEHRVATREEAIARYEEGIKEKPELLARLPELKGKILGCWCKPLPCHGDVLARLADGTDG